jgi:hypothetical protein
MGKAEERLVLIYCSQTGNSRDGGDTGQTYQQKVTLGVKLRGGKFRHDEIHKEVYSSTCIAEDYQAEYSHQYNA